MWLSGQKQSVIVFITDYLLFLLLQTNITASPSRDTTSSTTYSVGLEVSPVCGIAVMVDGFEVLAGVGAGWLGTGAVFGAEGAGVGVGVGVGTGETTVDTNSAVIVTSSAGITKLVPEIVLPLTSRLPSLSL